MFIIFLLQVWGRWPKAGWGHFICNTKSTIRYKEALSNSLLERPKQIQQAKH